MSTQDLFKHNNLQDTKKKATYSDCKYWMPIKL